LSNIFAYRPHTVASYLISGAADPAPGRPIPPIIPIPIGIGLGAVASSPSPAGISAEAVSAASGIGAGLDASLRVLAEPAALSTEPPALSALFPSTGAFVSAAASLLP